MEILKRVFSLPSYIVLIYTFAFCAVASPLFAEDIPVVEPEWEETVTETVDAAVEDAIEENLEEAAAPVEAAAEEVQEEVAEAVEEPVAEEAAEEMAPDYSDVETLPTYHPDVYIVALGSEMNLKVEYDHPMDFTNDNYIKQVQMEKIDGTFLGLKPYHERSKKAYAEFLVNPAMADFKEVVLIAESTKHGTIKSVHELKFTPIEKLPDKYNPKKAREMALKRAAEVQKQMDEAGIVPGGRDRPENQKKAAAAEEPKKKKKFGLF